MNFLQTLITESNKTVSSTVMLIHWLRSYKDADLQNTINSFDICTPDGFPVAIGFTTFI